MPHKCTKCKKVYNDKEKQIILHGCECGCKRFFYVKNGNINNVEMVKEKPQDSVASTTIDEVNAPVEVDESIKNNISVSELEDGKYIIDIASEFADSNEKKK